MKKILFLVTVAILLTSCTQSAKPYVNLTTCLRENKIVMFGASWCSHCASQKKLFQKSVKDMPYFECAVGSDQAPECSSRNIASYPTWQFSDTTIKSLPKDALKNLLDTEYAKVKSSTDVYRGAISENKPELLTTVEAFAKKTEALMVSSLWDYEKLTQLTALTEGPNETLTERPVYILGRIAGERSLTEIALYAWCSDAYQNDMIQEKI